MADTIYKALNLLGQDGILWTVAATLVLFGICGWRSADFSRIAPALMTSMGIFGTFCGIFVALYPLDFSPGKVNDSIEALLGGMKTAFVTSLVGLFSAILYRSVIGPAADSRRLSPEESVSREERELLKRLEAIRQAIAGDSDSSLVTQIRALRDESRDGFGKLEGLSDAIRNALVENIKELMKDIQQKIGVELKNQLQELIRQIRDVLIDRLGSTFIDLKDATVALNEWQQQHRAQVEQLTIAFNGAAQNLQSIMQSCQAIPGTMENLRNILEAVHHDVQELDSRVKAFAGMREQAEKSFPSIKKHLDEIGENLSSSAEGFKELKQTLLDTFESAEAESRRLVGQHTKNIEDLAANMRQTMENAQKASADKVTQIVEEGLKKFDEEVSKEINGLTRLWGGNLVAIARDCAEAIEAAKREGR